MQIKVAKAPVEAASQSARGALWFRRSVSVCLQNAGLLTVQGMQYLDSGPSHLFGLRFSALEPGKAYEDLDECVCGLEPHFGFPDPKCPGDNPTADRRGLPIGSAG
jgi:hypothetical protein